MGHHSQACPLEIMMGGGGGGGGEVENILLQLRVIDVTRVHILLNKLVTFSTGVKSGRPTL